MRDFSVTLPEVRTPWERSFKERCHDLSRAVRTGIKIVLMVYDAPNTSSFRYRVYNVKQWLEGCHIHIVYFYRYELDYVETQLDNIDLLVFARTQWTIGIQKVLDLAHMQGVPIVYDVDDIICSLDKLPLVTNTLNVDIDNEVAYSFWSAGIGRGEMVAKQCDAYVSTNPFLAQQLSLCFPGKPSLVIENSLNREQLEISERVLAVKRAAHPDGEFLIGYFSGTPSHINDFKIVAPEILQILKDFPQTRLIVVGFMDFPAETQPMIEAGRVIFKPLVDFMELQAEMAAVDVSIVPLVDNDFTNCKSELKYFEASIVETLTLATPIYTYAHSIRDGENGFLCRNGQWYQRLAEIIQRKVDVASIVARAKDDCLSRYAGENFAQSAISVYGALMDIA